MNKQTKGLVGLFSVLI